MKGRPTPTLLRVATRMLPARHREWGVAMRAELAAIEDPQARRRFARGASRAALRYGVGVVGGIALTVGALVTIGTLIVSRVQLAQGGPGVLSFTVPVPAVLILVTALIAAAYARSFRFGLVSGTLALLTSAVAVAATVALEGQLWMEGRGVFMLDAEPVRQAVSRFDVAVDLFTTGMWLGHLIFWLPWPLIGAAVGARLGGRRDTRAPRAAAVR